MLHGQFHEQVGAQGDAVSRPAGQGGEPGREVAQDDADWSHEHTVDFLRWFPQSGAKHARIRAAGDGGRPQWREEEAAEAVQPQAGCSCGTGECEVTMHGCSLLRCRTGRRGKTAQHAGCGGLGRGANRARAPAHAYAREVGAHRARSSENDHENWPKTRLRARRRATSRAGRVSSERRLAASARSRQSHRRSTRRHGSSCRQKPSTPVRRSRRRVARHRPSGCQPRTARCGTGCR